MANQFKLAEAFTEFTIKGWTQFKARMTGARRLAMAALAPFRALGGLIRKVFTPLGVGLGALGTGAAIVGLVRLSSAATETRNAFQAVFADTAEDAEKWVQQMARTFRRNETNIRLSMLKFQSFFVGIGASSEEALQLSKTMQQVQMDLQSFRDLPGDEAGRRLLSGLTGQMRTLIELGINVQEGAVDLELVAQGFEKGAASADRLTKALAAMKIIIDTARKQGLIGDLARTSGEAANQFRAMWDALKTLGERVGDLLIPVFKELAFLASAISDVMGRVAKEILPTVVAFFAPLTSMLHTLALGIQNIDINTITEDLGSIINKTMTLFRDLFLLTMEAGGKILMVWAKLAGEVFSEGLSESAKRRVMSFLGFIPTARLLPPRTGAGGQQRGPLSREELSADTTLGLFKQAGAEAKKLAENFRADILGDGGDAQDARQNARDLTEANVKAGRSLIESMLSAIKGAGGAGAGGPSFFAVGFSALQKHLQSQVSKGEDQQIKLLQQGNDQRAAMAEGIINELQNPQPVPVGV